MKGKRHIQSFNEHQENLNSELSKDTSSSISDVMKRINSLLDEYENLKIELSKSDDDLDTNWPRYIRRKEELENVFQVLGIKYVS